MHTSNLHYVKSVRVRSFPGPYFPAFGQNTERHAVSLRINSKYGNIRTRKTPNTDTFHVVLSEKMKFSHDKNAMSSQCWIWICKIYIDLLPTRRSSSSVAFCKKVPLKKIAKFTWKHLCCSLFFCQVAGYTL